MAISWVVEQGSRVIFLLLLMQKYQMMGILIAWYISLVLKVIYQFWAINRYVTPLKGKIYPWQSFIAPGLAATVNFLIFESFARLIFNYDILTSVVLFISAFFVFIYLYSFFVGFFGGWDNNTLREFERAVQMVKGISLFARWLYASTAFGAKHSFLHLHNKYPVLIYVEASKEARELTILKKQLTM
jgi:hypothetical protein